MRHLADWILRIAGAAIVAGGFLYWHDMQAFGGLGDFLGSAFGLWLTIGALAAIVAFAIGVRADQRRRSTARSRSAPRSRRPATSRPRSCVQELAALQAKGRSLAKLNLALVTIAAFAMSTARYW